MNIYDLRKIIEVTSFSKTYYGCWIQYNKMGRTNSINLNMEDLFKELVSIGTYEEESRADFDNSPISQWDALNIAIRFELACETEKELNDSDLFSAIAKITKPK